MPYLYTLNRTIPYLYTLNRTIPYLIKLSRTIPYLNTLSRNIPYVNTLSRTIPYLKTLNRTIPYLNTSRKNPNLAQNQILVGSQSESSITVPKIPKRSRLGLRTLLGSRLLPNRVGSLLPILIHGGSSTPLLTSAHTLTTHQHRGVDRLPSIAKNSFLGKKKKNNC